MPAHAKVTRNNFEWLVKLMMLENLKQETKYVNKIDYCMHYKCYRHNTAM